MELENRLVFCENPTLEGIFSSRICQENSVFEVYPEGVELDFNVINTLEDVSLSLTAMAAVGVHIMGSRGYIYSSRALSEIVDEYIDNNRKSAVTCFPRTFGLRAKVIQLLTK